MNKKFLVGLPVALLCANAQAKVEYDFYGFIKASYLHSDNSVSSFGNDSIQAPTEAQNIHTDETTGSKQTANYKNQSKDSFQVAQTRFGVTLKKSEKLSAKLEFDLTDFTNNPIAKNDARLRIGEIYYKFSENLSMRVGQGWTSFAGVSSFTFSPVASNFRAGQTGFLAHQAELKYTMNKLSFFGALSQKGRNLTGYPKSNGGNTDPLVQDVSSRGLPQVIGKVEYNNDTQKVGVAYTYAKFDYDNVDYVNGSTPAVNAHGESTKSYGGKVYYQGKMDRFELRGEAFQGSNLNDLNFLSLADHTVSTGKNRNIQEFGYFLSGRYNCESGDTVYAGYGHNKITTKTEKLAIGKLVENQNIRLGYSHLIEEGFQGFIELTQFRSHYTKAAAGKDVTAAQALLAEAGFMYNF